MPAGLEKYAQFLPMILMFAIIYFLMIRPQMKKQKEHQEMINSVQKGDKVVTNGGILGIVKNVNEKENTLEIEVDSDVKITIQRHAITGVNRA